MFGLFGGSRSSRIHAHAELRIRHAALLAPKRLWSDILESLEQTETGGVQRWDVLSDRDHKVFSRRIARRNQGRELGAGGRRVYVGWVYHERGH